MKVDLPDVNLWIALIDSQHTMHVTASAYWDTLRSERVAFCRVTMLGLFRVATNPKAMYSAAFSFPEMWSIYDELIALPEMVFLQEPDLEAAFRKETSTSRFGHNQWTDAYLAAFASGTSARLVTLDRGFRQRPNLDLLILQG